MSAADRSACLACERIDRRSFLEGTVLASVAALLAGCMGGGGSTDPSFTGPLTVRPSDLPALASVGGIATTQDAHGSPVAVVRVADQQYAAFSLICPHQGATVGVVGSAFRCPQHGAQFAADGHWTGGQRTSNLQALAAAYDASTGELTIS
jgi:Rieske Fe-S protein